MHSCCMCTLPLKPTRTNHWVTVLRDPISTFSLPSPFLFSRYDFMPNIYTFSINYIQLTMFHLLSISKRLSTHRLIPTAFSSLLSLLHFHGTLFSHYRRSNLATVPPPPTPTSSSRPSSHVNYPLLNYIPNFFETLLICTILLTLFLNAFAQLLVRGRIDRVLSQLGIGYGSSLHGRSAMNG